MGAMPVILNGRGVWLNAAQNELLAAALAEELELARHDSRDSDESAALAELHGFLIADMPLISYGIAVFEMPHSAEMLRSRGILTELALRMRKRVVEMGSEMPLEWLRQLHSKYAMLGSTYPECLPSKLLLDAIDAFLELCEGKPSPRIVEFPPL